MSTITRHEIESRLKSAEADRLVITPILSPKQIGVASVDVRLGNQFISFRLHTCGVFEPYKTPFGQLHAMQERHVVRFGDHFVLHPRALALGSTFEYICMPSNLEAQVEGRSSWARVGLQIATATSVEPGFRGVLTLELSNVGTIPIQLYPGVRIAQLFFREANPPVEDPCGDRRKYRCAIGPEFSQIRKDEDGSVFTEPIDGYDEDRVE
jgi:dCTP deaminase